MYKAVPGGSQGWWDTQCHGVGPAGHRGPGSSHQHSAAEDVLARERTPDIVRLVHDAPYLVGALFVQYKTYTCTRTCFTMSTFLCVIIYEIFSFLEEDTFSWSQNAFCSHIVLT